MWRDYQIDFAPPIYTGTHHFELKEESCWEYEQYTARCKICKLPIIRAKNRDIHGNFKGEGCVWRLPYNDYVLRVAGKDVERPFTDISCDEWRSMIAMTEALE